MFGWGFEPWGPPGFYLIHTGDDASPGIQGLMHKRQEPRTGTGLNGVEPTFSVDDLDAVAAAVEANGGTITMAKARDPDGGHADPLPRHRGQRHRRDAVEQGTPNLVIPAEVQRPSSPSM